MTFLKHFHITKKKKMTWIERWIITKANTVIMIILPPQTRKCAQNIWKPWEYLWSPVPWCLTKALSHRQAQSHACLYVYCSKSAEAAAHNSEIPRVNLQCPLQISIKHINISQGHHCGQTTFKWQRVKQMRSYLLPLHFLLVHWWVSNKEGRAAPRP